MKGTEEETFRTEFRFRFSFARMAGESEIKPKSVFWPKPKPKVRSDISKNIYLS